MKIIALISMLLCTVTFSQVSSQWTARYNPPTNGADEVRDITIDASGNVYVTGSSTVPVTFSDILTVKYNSAGAEQWTARYTGIGGGNNDNGVNVAVDASGNVYVCGTSYGGTGLALDIMVLKYNSSGSLVWDYRFTGPDGLDDEAYKMVLDASSNIYVCGTSTGSGTQKDFVVFKLNSAGATQWSKRYNHANYDDYPIDLAVDASGNVVVTGYSSVPGNGYDFMTVKYSSAGVQQWVFPFNVGGEEIGLSLGLDAAGNAYIGGYTNAYGTGNDCFVYSLNSTGGFRWFQRYTGPGNNDDKVNCITTDASGNVFAAGSSTQGTNSNDVFAVRYNSSGVQQWMNTLNVGGIENVYSISRDAASNLFLAGKTSAYGNGDDYLTLSYDPAGNFRWLTAYNYSGSQSDVALKVIPDNSGNVFVTGTSFADYATIKYSQLTGLQNVNSGVPSDYQLSQNYPNPFNPSTNINFNLPVGGNVKLSVFDVSAKEVVSLVDEYLSSGSYGYTFDASNLPSGTYFCRLISGSFAETKKMILIK
ncbi:MAG: SBBP repeat-containing protein [Ignavibacteria bacterium]|nr:SBBP repeat-containing protein [Ignavibacteria bacterium]